MGDVSSSTMKISASVFKNMINRVNKFISKKGRDPEIVFLGRGSRDYITYERFKEMLVRWNKYKKENGREPAYVWIVPAASQVSPPSPPPSPPSPPPSKRLGFWVWGSQMKEVNFPQLSAIGCTDIFLGEAAFKDPASPANFIQRARSAGIKVHGWITCLKDGGKWISPENAENLTRVKLLAEKMVNLGCDGVHLDYIRYPGTAYQIKNASDLIARFIFVIHKTVKTAHNNVILSAAVMPEMEANANYYGQDYAKMGRWLDWIIPMAYKGNYRTGSEWIGKVVKYIVKHSGKPVLAGLQTYRSDNNPSPIPASELKGDIKIAYENGASGVVLFRYGLVAKDFFK